MLKVIITSSPPAILFIIYVVDFSIGAKGNVKSLKSIVAFMFRSVESAIFFRTIVTLPFWPGRNS